MLSTVSGVFTLGSVVGDTESLWDFRQPISLRMRKTKETTNAVEPSPSMTEIQLDEPLRDIDQTVSEALSTVSNAGSTCATLTTTSVICHGFITFWAVDEYKKFIPFSDFLEWENRKKLHSI